MMCVCCIALSKNSAYLDFLSVIYVLNLIAFKTSPNLNVAIKKQKLGQM